MTTRRLSLIAAALLGGTALGGAAQAEPLTLTILLVNDLDRMEEADGRGGFARLAGVVDAVTAEADHVLLVHAGDAISPSLMSSFDKGAHIIALLNQLGVDAFVPGNHEFDFGPATALERFAEAEFPIVSSNITDASGAQLAGTRHTEIIDVGPFKIGFLGITTPDTVELATTDDLQFADSVATARQVGAELREAGADLVVAVGHVDIGEDLEIMRSGTVDLLLSGHDHILWSYFDGRTAGAESLSQAEYVTRITLTLDEVTSGDTTRFTWRPSFESLDSAAFEPQPAMAEAVQSYLDRLSSELDVVIGKTGTALDSRRAVVRGEEAAIGNLIADAVRAAVDADIAITNGGGIRADKEYAAGSELTRRDIQSELPFGNVTVKLRLSGADVLAALENGFSQVESGAGRFPQVSGLTVHWDASRPPGSRVTEVLVGGEPLDPAATYDLATNDYMASGGDGYDAFTAGEVVIGPLDGGIMANQVMDYVEAAGTVSPAVEGRIVRAN